MDLLATGNTVQPGLPARTGDAPSDGEKSAESAIFEVFLGLALTMPSPDGNIASGPEGETAPDDATLAPSDGTGNPAMPGGNILPLALPPGFEAIAMGSGQSREADAAAPVAGTAPAAVALPTNSSPAETGAAPRTLPVPAAQQPPAEVVAVPATLAKAIEALPQAQAAGQQAPDPASRPAPQPAPASAVMAEAVAVANIATPVVSVLSGRQRNGEPVRAAHAVTPASGTSAPSPELPYAPQSSPAPVAAAIDKVQQPAPVTASAPEVDTHEAAIESAVQRAPTEASSTQPAAIVSAQAEPMAPISDTRPAVQPSGGAPVAPAGSPQPAARDFGDIVDRLVRARDAEQPEVVRSTLATRDFGMVSMQLRPVEGRLHVAMTASDPGFAPAVQAAGALAGAGQQALSDNSAQGQSQGQQQQSAQQSGQGQSASPDSQARRQQWERAAEGQSPQGPSTPSGDDGGTAASARSGAAGGAIYA